ncbi:MAG: hypothetical protein R3E31_15975 [Chloroflexota bacterium]
MARKDYIGNSAVILLVLITVGIAWWRAQGRERYQKRIAARSAVQVANARRTSLGAGLLLLLVLPFILGTYLLKWWITLASTS